MLNFILILVTLIWLLTIYKISGYHLISKKNSRIVYGYFDPNVEERHLTNLVWKELPNKKFGEIKYKATLVNIERIKT